MMTTMTEIKLLDESGLNAIEARINAATKGPWVYFGQPHDNVFWGEIRSAAEDGHFDHITDTPELDERDNDMEFIAHAREDIPALIATIRNLQAANAALCKDMGQQLQQAHGAVRRYQDEDERLKSRILSAIKDKAEGWDSEADKARSISTRRGALHKRDAAREIIKLVEEIR